jgi:hypothetical protein
MSLIFKGGKHCLAISVPATLIAWLSHGCSLIPVIFSVSSLITWGGCDELFLLAKFID